MDRKQAAVLLVALIALGHINESMGQIVRRRRQARGNSLGRVLTQTAGVVASLALAGVAARTVTGALRGRRRRPYVNDHGYDSRYGGRDAYRDSAYGGIVRSGHVHGGDVYGGDAYGGIVRSGHVHADEYRQPYTRSAYVYPSTGTRRVYEYEYQTPVVSHGLGTRRYVRSETYDQPYGFLTHV